MNRNCIVIIASLAFIGGARAENATIIAIRGDCQVVQIANRTASCPPDSSVIYSNLPNGITLFNVPLSDGRVLGFIGDRDSQISAEEYVLYLRRVRLARGAESENPIAVTGTCKMNVSTDGSVVHRITCDASDTEGNKFLLDFGGNGLPVTHVR
jgi:hypothetical protein